jgi:hypothetical protein
VEVAVALVAESGRTASGAVRLGMGADLYSAHKPPKEVSSFEFQVSKTKAPPSPKQREKGRARDCRNAPHMLATKRAHVGHQKRTAAHRGGRCFLYLYSGYQIGVGEYDIFRRFIFGLE